MATLKLNSIECVTPQGDGFLGGGDEVYLTFDDLGGNQGNVTTNIIPDMHRGVEKPLTDRFSFSGSVSVSLTEDDGPGGGRDDYIDTREISNRPVENANIAFEDDQSDAHYVLNYDVMV